MMNNQYLICTLLLSKTILHHYRELKHKHIFIVYFCDPCKNQLSIQIYVIMLTGQKTNFNETNMGSWKH